MDDKKELNIECSTIIEDSAVDFGKKIHYVLYQTPPKTEEKHNTENLSERFKTSQHNHQTNDKTGQRANLLKKDANKLKLKYNQARKNVKPEILETLKMDNYNIIAVSPVPIEVVTQNGENIVEFLPNYSANPSIPQTWRYLYKSDFYDDLDKEEKDTSYRAIRDYLFLEYNNQQKIGKNVNTPDTNEKICTNYSLCAKIPPSILDFLYGISCGNLGSIRQLAKLWAQIQFKFQNIKPTVILADKSVHKSLLDFFAESLRICEVELNKITTKEGRIHLFNINLNNYFSAFLSVNSPLPLSHSKSETLRKIMKGIKINVKHPEFSGDLFIYNRIPFIYITDSHENYNILKYQYGAKTIELSGKNVTYIHQSSANYWLNNDFAIFGELLSNSKHTMSVSQPKIIEDNIIEKFIKELCILDKNSDIPKSKLFEAYQEYFKKNYGNTVLTKKQFNSKIAIIADLDECRPHHNTDSNPRCFKGITIDENKYQLLIESTNENAFLCDIELFAESLYDKMYKNLLSEDDFKYYKKRYKQSHHLKVGINK